jgi:glycine/D-amino acid oxidase-like deaminating enzyme
MKTYDVMVVGAGTAGQTAAYELIGLRPDPSISSIRNHRIPFIRSNSLYPKLPLFPPVSCRWYR